MSMMYQPSNQAFFDPEDVRELSPEQVQQLIDQGVLSPAQPGLNVPADTTIPPEQVAPPVDPYAAKRRYYTASSKVVIENGRRIQVVTDIDGNETRTDIGPAETVDGNTKPGETEAERIARLDREESARQFAASQAAEAAARGQRRESARQIVKSFLSKYNISGLDDSINNILNDGIEDSNAVLFMLRDTPEFQKRFAANRRRKESGFAELDFATYIGMENAYRETMQAFGLPEGFYNDQKDFEKLIEGDVSLAELTNRIRDGFVKVRDADPAVRQQMFELYGVTESDLAAYFIDPERSRPLMMAQDYKKQAAAAGIAARGLEQGGLQLSKEEAESLAGRGVTPEQARAQFTQRRELAGLFEEMGGEESLTRQQKLGATFGYDVESQIKLERRRDLRLGEFRGGGGFARTSGATSGTVETGVGTAQ